MTHTASRRGSGSSDAALLIGWGSPVHGREQKAPQVLHEVLSYCRQLQERGAIDGYDAVALEPHGRQMNSCLLVRGNRENINRIRSNEEFIRLCNRARLATNNVDVIGGFMGETFERMVNDWQQQARDLT